MLEVMPGIPKDPACICVFNSMRELKHYFIHHQQHRAYMHVHSLVPYKAKERPQDRSTSSTMKVT